MKRTWTALALAGAMVFQLAACGTSGGSSSSSSASGGTEAALVLVRPGRDPGRQHDI